MLARKCRFKRHFLFACGEHRDLGVFPENGPIEAGEIVRFPLTPVFGTLATVRVCAFSPAASVAKITKKEMRFLII